MKQNHLFLYLLANFVAKFAVTGFRLSAESAQYM